MICPICGEEADDTPGKVSSSSDMSCHMFFTHGDSKLQTCWCGEVASPSMRSHCLEFGGYEQHYLDHLMGVKPCK